MLAILADHSFFGQSCLLKLLAIVFAKVSKEWEVTNMINNLSCSHQKLNIRIEITLHYKAAPHLI